MFRTILATVLAAVLWMPVGVMAGEFPDAPSETKRVENLRKNADALRLSGKRTAVVLKDNSKITGQITTLTDDGFALRTTKGDQRQLSFAQVRTVKKSGLSTGAKVLIGVGAVVGGIIIAGCAVYCGRND